MFRYGSRSLQVIAPGMDFSSVVVQEDTAEADGDLTSLTNTEGSSPKAIPSIWAEVSTSRCIYFLPFHQKFKSLSRLILFFELVSL